MSTVKTNNVQVGNSGTASNNFTWYQPAVPDGTVRLGQGNSGATTSDILVVSSTGLSIGGSSIPASRIVQGTAQTTNGAAAYGYTGLPSWVKKITFVFKGVSTVNTVSRQIQVGTSSGYASSGYVNTLSQQTSGSTGYSASPTTYFQLTSTYTSAHSGVVQLFLTDSSTNTWTVSGTSQIDGATYFTSTTSGYVVLSGVLDRIQILPTSGNFSGGTINIIYEG